MISISLSGKFLHNHGSIVWHLFHGHTQSFIFHVFIKVNQGPHPNPPPLQALVLCGYLLRSGLGTSAARKAVKGSPCPLSTESPGDGSDRPWDPDEWAGRQTDSSRTSFPWRRAVQGEKIVADQVSAPPRQRRNRGDRAGPRKQNPIARLIHSSTSPLFLSRSFGPLE